MKRTVNRKRSSNRNRVNVITTGRENYSRPPILGVTVINYNISRSSATQITTMMKEKNSKAADDRRKVINH